MAKDYKTTPAAFGPGEAWLTADEAARVTELAGYRRLYEGDHRKHFWSGGKTQHEFKALGAASNVLYIADNLAGICTLKHADLLLGEPLSVAPADGNEQVAAAVARIDEASSMAATLYELAVTAGWAGRAYAQVLVKRGRVRVEIVPPEHVFPRYELGGRELVGGTIKYPVTIAGKRYLRVIEHDIGQIRQGLYELDKAGRVLKASELSLLGPGVEPVQMTGLAEPALVEVENFAAARGRSDYHRAEDLLDEVNNRLTQISRILDQHGDPAMVALRELFDEQGNLKISGRAVAADTLEKGDPVRYLTWDAKLAEAANQLDRAMRAYLRRQETAPLLVGLDGGNTSADTWKKFKLAVSQTLARVNRKQLFMTPGVVSIYRVAQQLENLHVIGVSYPVTPVSLTWSDGLPVDDEELMRIVSGYRAAGLMSRKMALTWMHGDPRVVAEELEALQAESEASLPTSFRDGAIDLVDEGGQ